MLNYATALLVLASFHHQENQPVTITVGEQRTITGYSKLKRVAITAKSTDEKICIASATPSGAVRLSGNSVGKANVWIRGTYRPDSSKENYKIHETIEVTVKPRPLPEYYYDAVGYVQTLGPNLDLMRRDWKLKIVGLPKYYRDKDSADLMTEKDVDKAFIVPMPAGEIDAVAQSKLWLATIRKSGSDFQNGKIDEVAFSNQVIGAYVKAIGWEWVIVQRMPDLYAAYFNTESVHRMQAHWDRKNKALWENRALPTAKLAGLTASENAILNAAAKIDFDHFANLMKDAGAWVREKHQAIGSRLMTLQQDLNARSRTQNDLYFQQAAYAKEQFFVVWYGASFYSPRTYNYPSQRVRIGYRTSASGFAGVECAEQFPHPTVQVSPAESQFLGYFLPLDLPAPSTTEGRDAPRIPLRLAPMDFTSVKKITSTELKQKARDLATRKSKLEQEISTLVDQPKGLITMLNDLSDQQASLAKKIVQLEEDLKVIRGLEIKSAEVKALIEEQERQCQMRNELQVKLLDGEPVQQNEIEMLNRTIKVIGEVIEGKLRGTPAEGLRKKWRAALETLRTESLSIDKLSLRLQQESIDYSSQIEAKRVELRALDKQLLDVISQIDQPYPGLIGVSVESEGREVLRARTTGASENLDQIDEEIAQLEGLLEKVKAEQIGRKQAFLAAAGASIESGYRLATKIEVVAVEKAAIDTIFHCIDFSEAFASGGYVGLAMSVAQKELEAQVLESVIPKSDDKPQPGSPEYMINKAYADAELKDALTYKNAQAVGLNRLVKETGTRFAKDKVNQAIGAWVHERIETPLTLWTAGMRPAVSVAKSLERQSSMITRLAKETESLSKGYLYIQSPSELTPKKISELRVKKIQKLGMGVARDLVKNSLKSMCDADLLLAWMDYAECVMRERLQYKPYILDLRLRQDAYDSIDELLLRRYQLTSGMTTAQENLATEWSDPVKSNAVLQITLSFRGAEDLTRPLRVFVSGVEAARVGQSSTFMISAGKCRPDQDGVLAIQIR